MLITWKPLYLRDLQHSFSWEIPSLEIHVLWKPLCLNDLIQFQHLFFFWAVSFLETLERSKHFFSWEVSSHAVLVLSKLYLGDFVTWFALTEAVPLQQSPQTPVTWSTCWPTGGQWWPIWMILCFWAFWGTEEWWPWQTAWESSPPETTRRWASTVLLLAFDTRQGFHSYIIYKKLKNSPTGHLCETGSMGSIIRSTGTNCETQDRWGLSSGILVAFARHETDGVYHQVYWHPLWDTG